MGGHAWVQLFPEGLPAAFLLKGQRLIARRKGSQQEKRVEVGEPTQAGERAASRAEHGWGTSTYIHLRVRYLVLGPMWEAAA